MAAPALAALVHLGNCRAVAEQLFYNAAVRMKSGFLEVPTVELRGATLFAATRLSARLGLYIIAKAKGKT